MDWRLKRALAMSLWPAFLVLAVGWGAWGGLLLPFVVTLDAIATWRRER